MAFTDFIIQKKSLIIGLGVIIFGLEVVFLLYPGRINLSSQSQKLTTFPSQEDASKASLSLQTATPDVMVGENFEVEAVLATGDTKADAVDVIITFDPTQFQVVAVNSGELFSDYPQARFDDVLGKAYLSGVGALGENQAVSEGVIGSFTFNSLKAGPGEVTIEFNPGSTTDANVIGEGMTEDILGRVENLNINVE